MQFLGCRNWNFKEIIFSQKWSTVQMDCNVVMLILAALRSLPKGCSSLYGKVYIFLIAILFVLVNVGSQHIFLFLYIILC